MNCSLIVLGAGGHARVLLDALLRQGREIIGITSPNPEDIGRKIFGIPVIGPDDLIFNYRANAVGLVNGIGLMPGRNQRVRVYEKFKHCGYRFIKVIHPSAILGANVRILEGVQIMAGAVIQTGAVINENCLVNTRTVVEHDSIIGRNVHLASGVIVSGGVSIGDGSFVGAAATIIQGTKIGAQCIVAAGSLVLRNVPDEAMVMGIPSRVVNNGQSGRG